jgi:hypothetical protein
MIAVFQQFPPQVGAAPRRQDHDPSRSHRPAPSPRAGQPGSPRAGPPGPSNGRPAPKVRQRSKAQCFFTSHVYSWGSYLLNFSAIACARGGCV